MNRNVSKVIRGLKEKATSDTSIGPLKAVNTALAPTLVYVINASFQQGIVPSKVKVAKVVPLHKNGSKTKISNYRPISLLSSFSKLYE